MADATAHGIITEYLEPLQRGEVGHIVFPEFIRPLERSKETVASLIAFLGELVEEGIKEIQTYNASLRLPKPVKAGVIACIAKGSFGPRIKNWNATGFLSRFLVVSYS